MEVLVVGDTLGAGQIATALEHGGRDYERALSWVDLPGVSTSPSVAIDASHAFDLATTAATRAWCVGHRAELILLDPPALLEGDAAHDQQPTPCDGLDAAKQLGYRILLAGPRPEAWATLRPNSTHDLFYFSPSKPVLASNASHRKLRVITAAAISELIAELGIEVVLLADTGDHEVRVFGTAADERGAAVVTVRRPLLAMAPKAMRAATVVEALESFSRITQSVQLD